VISTLAGAGTWGGLSGEAVSAMRVRPRDEQREDTRYHSVSLCGKAGRQALSGGEMEALIKEWLSSRYPATCPHGRSICYRMEHKDIARKLDGH
jgi:DNA mismatch repair protein MutL